MGVPGLDHDVEKANLEDIAADSWYATGANGSSVRYSARVFARWFTGGHCLELGPAEGLMTSVLVEHFDHLTVVEGSERFASNIRRRYPDVEVVCSLFEDYEPAARYDAIVLGHVLEHISDPPVLLRRLSGWLTEDGRVFAAVPNARSLHRQAAVIMGLLGNEHELNATDEHHGHRRVYDPETFRADFLGAGLRVEHFGGYWIKPVSNAQIDQGWSTDMLKAFMVLGERYPDIAAEIYVVAKS